MVRFSRQRKLPKALIERFEVNFFTVKAKDNFLD